MNSSLKAALILALAAEPLAHAGELEPGESEVVEMQTDFADHLQDPARWQIGQAGTLTLKMDGDSTVFLLNGDKEMSRLKAPEYVSQAVLSEDGKCLVLLLMKLRGRGADPSTLLRVQAAAGKLTLARVPVPAKKLPEGYKWWLSEVGAVSNDGERVLAKFGIGVPDSRRFPYRWFTLELASGKILGEGLTVANGKKVAVK